MVPCLIAVPGYLVDVHLRASLRPGVGHARWGAVHPLALLLYDVVASGEAQLQQPPLYVLLVLTGKHLIVVTR